MSGLPRLYEVNPTSAVHAQRGQQADAARGDGDGVFIQSDR